MPKDLDDISHLSHGEALDEAELEKRLRSVGKAIAEITGLPRINDGLAENIGATIVNRGEAIRASIEASGPDRVEEARSLLAVIDAVHPPSDS